MPIPFIPLPYEANRTLRDANVTIEPPSLDTFNRTLNNLTGNGSVWTMNPDTFIGDAFLPFMQAYGIFFWAGIFGTMALVMFIKQERVWIPIMLTILGGLPLVIWQFPYDWQKAIGTIVILGIAMIMYAFRKKRL
jgi:hypothetical protein